MKKNANFIILEKKIDTLEKEGIILIARFKAREETIDGRDGSIAALQDRDKILKKELERKELAIDKVVEPTIYNAARDNSVRP
jgi:hypothetical protein